jgi:fermentation-respiration switch protein FrsA (DUF1100 family)
MIRIVLSVLLLAAAAYAVLLVALYLGQRHIIFRPDTARPDPLVAGLARARVTQISTADGLRLLAWFVPPAHDANPIVLYLHGNGGNIGGRAGRAQRFMAMGWGVLLAEYRGYGGNPGSPSEAGLMQDAAALAYLRAQGVGPERILLWGESLGTAMAVRLAGESDVAAVILESPYTSMVALGRLRYGFVPVERLLKDRFDSLSRITAVKAPLLIIQGGQDDIVPPEMGARLLAAATAPKELWVAPQAGHNDLAYHGAIEAAADFVSRHLPAG